MKSSQMPNHAANKQIQRNRSKCSMRNAYTHDSVCLREISSLCLAAARRHIDQLRKKQIGDVFTSKQERKRRRRERDDCPFHALVKSKIVSELSNAPGGESTLHACKKAPPKSLVDAERMTRCPGAPKKEAIGVSHK